MSRVAGVPGVDFTVEDVRGDFPEEFEIITPRRPARRDRPRPGLQERHQPRAARRRPRRRAFQDRKPPLLRRSLLADGAPWSELGFDLDADREGGEVSVEGLGGVIPTRDVDLFVGNAGTVARFLPPALALGHGPYTVDGVPRMRERPDLRPGRRDAPARGRRRLRRRRRAIPPQGARRRHRGRNGARSRGPGAASSRAAC